MSTKHAQNLLSSPHHLVTFAFKLNSCSDVLTGLPASTHLAPDHPLQSSKSHLSGTNHPHYFAHNPPGAPRELLAHFQLLTMVQEALHNESPAFLCSHPSYCSPPRPHGLACSFSVPWSRGVDCHCCWQCLKCFVKISS